MKPTKFEPDDARLGALLREARPSPTLPPRFQEDVWRRIEQADAKITANWLEVLAAWLVRPRQSIAVAAVLVVTGLGLGWNNGERLAHTEAQARYVAAVAPNALH
jgi:hypothetical protein